MTRQQKQEKRAFIEALAAEVLAAEGQSIAVVVPQGDFMKTITAQLSAHMFTKPMRAIKRRWMQSAIDGYYRDLANIKQDRANDAVLGPLIVDKINELEDAIKRI